jgi:hypothetical protein
MLTLSFRQRFSPPLFADAVDIDAFQAFIFSAIIIIFFAAIISRCSAMLMPALFFFFFFAAYCRRHYAAAADAMPPRRRRRHDAADGTLLSLALPPLRATPPFFCRRRHAGCYFSFSPMIFRLALPPTLLFADYIIARCTLLLPPPPLMPL